MNTLNRSPGRGRPVRGFTLIELMITVAIVGILAAIAYPSYQKMVLRANRADVKAILVETAQFMERYFTTNNRYTDAALLSTVSPKGASGGAIRYNISFSPPLTPTAFTVRAVPNGNQTKDTCGTLTLTNTGAQTPATPGCW